MHFMGATSARCGVSCGSIHLPQLTFKVYGCHTPSRGFPILVSHRDNCRFLFGQTQPVWVCGTEQICSAQPVIVLISPPPQLGLEENKYHLGEIGQ